MLFGDDLAEFPKHADFADNLFERAWDEREEGLRVNAAGAGAMSFSYIIKVDGGSFKV